MKREVGVELFRSGTRERSVSLNYHDSKGGGWIGSRLYPFFFVFLVICVAE